MSLRVLEHFQRHNIIVYAIPAHSSGKLQPCDTGLFGEFKRKVNSIVSDLCVGNSAEPLNVYDVCKILHRAFRFTFTAPKIASAFKRSGMWPVDPMQTMAVPRPWDCDDTNRLMSPQEMRSLFLNKCQLYRNSVLGGQEVVEMRRGFVNTTRGLVLTSSSALEAVRKNAREWREKQSEISKKASARERRERDFISRAEKCKWAVRAGLAKMSIEKYRRSVRSMRERRQIARERAKLRKEVVFAMVNMGSGC